MLTLTALLDPSDPAPPDGSLTLPFDLRRRSRLRTQLDDGTEAGLLLPRGLVLRDGDRLKSDDGSRVVRVRAAAEELSEASTDDPLLLARAAYHLGNRHVALQIRPGKLSYQHDHVLDGLARELGLKVGFTRAPFEPEAGGYSGDGHHSHGGHAHPHHHGHAHSHHDHGENGSG